MEIRYHYAKGMEDYNGLSIDHYPQLHVLKKKQYLRNRRKKELPPVGAVHLLLPREEMKIKPGEHTSGAKSVWKTGEQTQEEIGLEADWTPPTHKIDQGRIEEINRELEALIGLAKVKKLIKEVQAYVQIQQRRIHEDLQHEPLVLHMMFKGNPGSGKTTVARLIGRLFKEIGVLQKGHLIEVERADLVGEYIGHTAQKTREQVKKALGGILFIDEAYSLARGGERDFGKESIDALVKAMEDHKDNLVLILAGYHDEMLQFMQANPGVRSRFPIQIDFPDYTVGELMRIADQMLNQRQYCLSPDAREELKRILEQQIGKGMGHNGNARLVRNLIERGIRRQAVRLVDQAEISREDLILIRRLDIESRLGDL